MISVIIPTCNRAATLLRAIASVQAQTDPDWELLVVDDASSDETPALLAALSDPRIRVLTLPRQGGACAARNLGIAEARGEYIALLDSDDAWLPGKLAAQKKTLETTGADLTFCRFHRRQTDGTLLTDFPPASRSSGWIAPSDLLPENLMSTQTMFGKAEVFQRLLFDVSYPRLQDWEFALRAAQIYRVYYAAEILVDVYWQQSSISAHPENALIARKKLQARYAPLITRDVSTCVAWLIGMDLACRDCGQSVWPLCRALLEGQGRYAFQLRVLSRLLVAKARRRLHFLKTIGRKTK